MPGFLDDLGYGGVTRIDLGKDYWVDVKNCLTEEEIGFVNDLLGGKQRVENLYQFRGPRVIYR